VKKTSPRPARTDSPAHQLAGFLAEFTPEIARRATVALRGLRRLVPPSIEMVYDNYNFLVVGFSPTARPSDAVLSLAIYARGMGVCFIHGAKLPDPDRLLRGGGKQVRSLHLETGRELDDPKVKSLIASAIVHSRTPYPPGSKRTLVIQSISAKRRPRQPRKS
jgi:hypothetical protein